MFILVIHNMKDPSGWRESIAELELALPRNVKEYQYLIHDAALSLPDYAKEFCYDAIILNSTFLTAVFSPARLQLIKKEYEFIKHSDAFKIALPQDDYYCSEELDSLMKEWKIDLTYTVCPEHWDILYPKYLEAGGNLRLGFTSYITPRMRERSLDEKKRQARKYDIVYRASGVPTFPNGLAYIKSTIGTTFKTTFSDQKWLTNITTVDSKAILGNKWWDFIEDSRLTIGSNSGTSELIRNHSVVKKIREYENHFPHAEYTEVIKHCIPPEDCKYIFTAISPRALEAGLLETVQLLVPGPYSDILKPWEHYIPLQKDCSNRDEIVSIVNDLKYQDKIACKCKEKILNTPQLQIESLIAEMISAIESRRMGTDNLNRSVQFKRVVGRYRTEMPRKYSLHFYARRTEQTMKHILPDSFYRLYRKYKEI